MGRSKIIYGGGLGVLAWHPDGKLIAVGSKDGSLMIFRATDQITEACTLDDNNEPVSALAFHPSGDSLACAIKHTVNICKLGSDGESIAIDGFATRTTTDIHQIAFSPDSKLLAVASGENDITVVRLELKSQVMLASGHRCPVKCVTFNHDSKLMASAGVDGRLIIWTVDQLDFCLQQELAVMPATNGTNLKMQIDWYRSRLAVPSKLDVVVIERVGPAWKTVLRLSAGHTDQVSIVRWSPNGLYIASLAADKNGGYEILIWNVISKKRIGRKHSQDQLIGMEWNPKDNAIAILTMNGQLLIWDEPVSRELAHPCEQSEEDLAMEEEVDEEIEEDNEEMEEEADESIIDERRKRRRLVKREDSENEDDVDDIEVMDQYDDRYEDGSLYSHERYPRTGPLAKLQSPFQPGATSDANDPWMMNWNLFGYIESSAVDDVTRRIQINFADADARPRIRLTDRLGFNKASLGKFSALFSSPRSGDSIPATIFYRNFDSWAANSDWSATLPESEDVFAITLVGRNVAVCSDRGILRLMSHSGVHRGVYCLEHAVVCMIGSIYNHLAVIMTTPTGSYHYVLYQVDKQIRRLGSGSCPVSSNCTISWAGYSEEGLLLIMDSSLFVRGLVLMNGANEWVPFLDGATYCTMPKTAIWPVGASSTDLLVVTLRNGLTEPSVTNRPILNGLPFTIPTMLGDAQSVPLEQHYLKNTLVVANYLSLSDIGSNRQKNERKVTCARFVVKQDITLIELLRAAVNDNNISRALDLATYLSSEKSLDAARRIVERMNQPMLVERLDLLSRVMFPKQHQSVPVESRPASSSSFPRGPAPVAAVSPKPKSSTPVALDFSPSPASRPTSSVSHPTPTETQSMKPDFRRKTLLLSQAPARASSGFSSQLDQKRLEGGSTIKFSSRPF